MSNIYKRWPFVEPTQRKDLIWGRRAANPPGNFILSFRSKSFLAHHPENLWFNKKIKRLIKKPSVLINPFNSQQRWSGILKKRMHSVSNFRKRKCLPLLSTSATQFLGGASSDLIRDQLFPLCLELSLFAFTMENTFVSMCYLFKALKFRVNIRSRSYHWVINLNQKVLLRNVMKAEKAQRWIVIIIHQFGWMTVPGCSKNRIYFLGSGSVGDDTLWYQQTVGALFDIPSHFPFSRKAY